MATTYNNRTNSVNEEPKTAQYDNTTNPYIEQKRKNLIKKLKERGLTPEQIKQHPQLKKA